MINPFIDNGSGRLNGNKRFVQQSDFIDGVDQIQCNVTDKRTTPWINHHKVFFLQLFAAASRMRVPAGLPVPFGAVLLKHHLEEASVRI